MFSRCPLVSARRPFPVFVLFLVLFGSVCWFANASEPTLRLLRSLPPPQLFPPPRKGRAKTLASEKKKNARWESTPSKFPKNALPLFSLLSPTVSPLAVRGVPFSNTTLPSDFTSELSFQVGSTCGNTHRHTPYTRSHESTSLGHRKRDQRKKKLGSA